MKNLILTLTRETIPYVKQLRAITKSITGCILMQQLDYWFAKYPDGFYKFLAPPEQTHPNYKQGDSWQEEIGISADEFRTAFDLIGIRYLSKSSFNEAEDKFQGHYYCSYYDRVSRLTYYFRNHELTDNALTALITGQSLETGKSISRNGQPQSLETGKSISRNGQPQSLETGKSISRNGQPQSLNLYTEITSKTTAENIYTACAEPIYSSSDEILVDLIQPIQEVLISVGMAEEKETPIPPPPLAPLSPENVGLAIAVQPKVTNLDAKRNNYQVFLDVWLQEKPDDWVDHKTLSKTAISKLETFVKTHGSESMTIFQKSLWYAKSDDYHKKVLKGWTLEQYLSNEKPYQYYEKYEQAPKKDSTQGEIIMSATEVRKAKIYAQLQQAMGVAS